MRKDIGADEIVSALLADSRFDFRDVGGYLRKGICPSCGKRELFVRKSQPWQLKCGRESKCGMEFTAREMLPELFAEFAKRFPPTEENRQATADAYLGLDRGFDLSKIRGWYEQTSYQLPGTNDFCPAIRFYLDAARTRYWERLIDKTKKDGQKANFGGQKKADGSLFKGEAWTPPGQTLEKGDRVHIVEGIFHAIALYHKGYKVAAAFSCNHFPEDFLATHKGKGVTWVLALDGDEAGRKWTKRHAQKLRTMNEAWEALVLPNDGQDWDDLYRAGRITDAFMEDRLWHGRLFMAETVQEKAYHWYLKRKNGEFILDFKSALYAIKIDNKLAGELERHEVELGSDDGWNIFLTHCNVDIISNTHPQFLYMERDEIMDEQRYVFKIDYANGSKTDIIAMEGTAITAPDSFHKSLLNRAQGGTFDGTPRHLKILRDRWLNKRMLIVNSIPFVGYDRETKAWVYKDRAYHNGREIELNDNGYFEIGRVGIKSSLSSVSISTDGKFDPGWLPDFIQAFSWQGFTVLGYWLGSLFAQQIRAEQKSFPFLEFTGDPGAGKSTVLEFLWKCVGRDDYEGFDVMKSTVAGRRRAFSQVSNLPIVLIESDRDNGDKDAKAKQFDFDACKPFYNGRGTGTLGVSRRSNDVEESLFQASLVISQNAEVDGSEALLQRIVHAHADKAHHAAGSREIARWFERQSAESVGGFLRAALRNERAILTEYMRAFALLEEWFAKGGLRNERVIKNHAQVGACCYALAMLFPTVTQAVRDSAMRYLLGRAKARELRLAADHPIVEQFWETYCYLDAEHSSRDEGWINHSRDQSILAINLNQYVELCRAHGQELVNLKQLKALLPHSKRHKFVEANRTVNSPHLGKTLRCWIFNK